MSHCVVRLNGTEEVEEFVKAASKCDFDIDIFYNRSPAFNKTLQKFAVA